MLDLDVVSHRPLPPAPVILAPNHPSTTDPFLLTILTGGPVSILIDNTLFKVPIFGGVLSALGHIPVVPDRGRAAFDAAHACLDTGRSVVVFPEGRISPLSGGCHRPRTGAARLALLTGAPVIPVGIHLSRERIRLIETTVQGVPERGTWYITGPYAITVGEPLYLRGHIEDRVYVRALSAHIMQRITDLARSSEERVASRAGERSAAQPLKAPVSARRAAVTDT
jgi:1-acyl-sn-glycerol-3-phosphate acyltransferase